MRPFVLLRRVHVDEAIALYQRLYEVGRHRRPPGRGSYAWMFERGERWAIACIPLDNLVFQTWFESSPESRARAEQYASLPTALPPGVASYAEGTRARARRSAKAWVQDGNHRVLAAEIRNQDCALMLMPEGEVRALRRDDRRRMTPARR